MAHIFFKHKNIFIGLTPEECSDKKSLSTFFAELVTHCDDSVTRPQKQILLPRTRAHVYCFFEIDALFQVLPIS
jgi:hypothetical protein